MPLLDNKSLCPWERHLTLIFQHTLYVMWKRAQVSVSQRHLPEKKIKKQIKKQADMVLTVSAKEGFRNNCPMLNVYDVVFRVTRINRTN